MYEYQHLLVDAKMIAAVGDTRGDRAANDEARSQCWSDAVFLALNAGTKTSMEWRISRARAAVSLLQQSTRYDVNSGGTGGAGASRDARARVPYPEAYAWGRFFEVESLVGYLRARGLSKLTVVDNRPDAMNAVMSVCRAMTRHPLDLAARNGYPASQVRFVPFFPANISKHN